MRSSSLVVAASSAALVLAVSSARADEPDLHGMIRNRLHLKRDVVVVVPRRPVVELDAAQREPVRVDVDRIEDHPAAGVEADERSVR